MRLITLERIIERQPFFSDLAPKYLQLVSGCAQNRRFADGEFIFREGERAEEFFLIREGRATLCTSAPGRGLIPFQTVGPGDVLGWSWLFEPYDWFYCAKAIEPVRALAFDGICLRNKCEEDHEFGYDFMKRFAGVMIERLQAARLHMLDVYAG